MAHLNLRPRSAWTAHLSCVTANCLTVSTDDACTSLPRSCRGLRYGRRGVRACQSLGAATLPSETWFPSRTYEDRCHDDLALIRPPEFSLRWTAVWRRNQLVWRKLAFASVLGNIADPLLYMVALGYGIGAFVPEVGGMKYIAFIGTGMVCQSAMFTSSFEAMYSAFSRMHVQRTWDAIINAPISLDDVVFAEWIWAASKAVMSTTAILAVILALGFGHSWYALWILPLGFLVGLDLRRLRPRDERARAELRLLHLFLHAGADAVGLLLSGVFFPVSQMPGVAAGGGEPAAAEACDRSLPPAPDAEIPPHIALHVAVLLAYACAAYYVALVLTRRRLLR